MNNIAHRFGQILLVATVIFTSWPAQGQEECAAERAPVAGYRAHYCTGMYCSSEDTATTWHQVSESSKRRTTNQYAAADFAVISTADTVVTNNAYHVEIEYSWEVVDQWGNNYSETSFLNMGTDLVCPSGYALGQDGQGMPRCYLADTNLRQCPLDEKPDKNRACPPGSAMVGNPCNIGSGNKYQVEVDYPGVDGYLIYSRYYNSDAATPIGSHAKQWRGTYDRFLVFSSDMSVNNIHTGSIEVYAHRADGRVVHFLDGPIGIQSPKDPDTVEQLRRVDATTWELTDASGAIETYRPSSPAYVHDDFARLESIRFVGGALLTLEYSTTGTLKTVKDSFDHKLTFTYNASNRITKFTDPAGKSYLYSYNGSGYITKVTYPDSTFREYTYGTGVKVGTLVGIKDESGAAYAAWAYDNDRRPVSSTHAGGAESTTITYNPDGTATVTDGAGGVYTYAFDLVHGAQKLASTTINGVAEQVTRDSAGFVSSRTDRRGIQTTYSHDARGLELSRTEASGSPLSRTTTTNWHATAPLPVSIDEANRTTAFTHDANGNILAKTITDIATGGTRTWTYSYDTSGRRLTVNGPRTDVSDVTTYTYYTCSTGVQCGRLQTVKNALNQVTTFNTYNTHGQPLTITDANGVLTTLTYDLRTRLTSVSRAGETTSLSYHPTGLLQRVTLPDTSYVQYTYDNAHRLTEVADGLGNRVVYSLDSMGNRTAEGVYDPSSALARTRSRVYNSLNQLWKELTASGASAQTTEFAYDLESNLTSINAPLGRNTTRVYDELGRLQQVTDAALGATELGYDANDHLVSVTDPKALVTSYSYSGFGDLLQQVSPDTGTTVMTYDDVGNVATVLDARGKLANYSYDAIDRVTQIAYGDQTVAFTYDAGANGKGQLTQASDSSGTTSWTYTPAGRVSARTQAMGSVSKTVSLGYNVAGRLTTMTLPSGQVVTYTYVNSRVASVKVGATTILDNVLYEPFGVVRQWSWGNGTLAVHTHDLDGKLMQVDSAGLHTYSYDDASRITAIADASNSTLNQSYGYDSLDRLTSGSGSTLNQGWTYDANSSRLTQTGSSASTHAVSGGSNRVTSISGALARTYTYDGSGNVTADGNSTFVYNDAGRMTSATRAGVTTSYAFNALGQRVKKTATGASTHFVYDEGGQLIGEYDTTGALIQETVWMDHVPVATLRPNGSGVSIFYVHTDHLNAPRRISRPSDNVIVWRWDRDPFGTTAASEDPDGDSTTLPYNLRFAGQYFDSETGLHYNYFRDYDPSTGRYIQSDPIGLAAGVNTFGYVGANPVRYADPLGLDANDSEGEPGFGFRPLFPAFTRGTPQYNDLVNSGTQFLNDLERLLPGRYLAEKKPQREQKPDGCPKGTKPVNKDKRLDREKIHKIKRGPSGINAEPKDWVGIDPAGNIWTNENGTPLNNGHYTDYLN